MSKQKITADIKKLLRILFLFLAGVLVVLGISYALLRTPYVQTSLVRYFTERIEQKTGVKIHIGGVDFRPMKSLVLSDVLLRDFREDTLIYCKNMRVVADSFNLVNRSFTISEVVFDEAYFNLWITRGENGAVMNIEMFLDSLAGKSQNQVTEETEKVSGGRGWLVGLDKISVRRSRFTYREDEYEPVDYGVNWTDIDCLDLNVDVSEFNFSETVTGMRVSGLSLREKSGLTIKRLDGKLAMKSGNMMVTESRIVLERSNVDLIKLEYNWTPDQHDWRNFVRKMHQYYEIGPSSVSFIDLAYFNGILRGIDNTVRCSGIVSNTISELEGRDLYFELGDRTLFQGQFKSRGLPDVRKTLFNIELTDAHIAPADLESVYLPWFGTNIPIPSVLHKLPSYDLSKVNFDGILEDFIVKANSVTPALAGNLKFVYAPCGDHSADCTRMKGDFNFNRVNVAKFSGYNLLGNAALSGSYSGTLDEKGIDLDVKGKINKLDIHRGKISDADYYLTWKGEKIDLVSSFENDCAHAGIVLSYDMNDSLDFLSVRGNVRADDLNSFGLSLLGAGESASGKFDIISAGCEGDRFTTLTLSGLKYNGPSGGIDLERVDIEEARSGEQNTVTLQSDIADVFLDGNYQDIRPLDFATSLLRSYLPAYADNKRKKIKEKDTWKNLDFRYEIDIKDINRVLKVVYPDLQISSGSKITSHFRYGNDLMNLSMYADTIHYRNFSLIHSKIDLNGDPRQLSILYNGDRVKFNGPYQLYNVRNELKLHNNRLDNKLSWCNWESRTYSGELAAAMTFIPTEKGKYKTEISVEPGIIVLADSVWRVRKSTILIDGKNVDIENFSIGRDDQYLQINGKISENPEDKLLVNLMRLDLSELNRLVFNNRMKFFGVATGNLNMQDYYKDRSLASDFVVENWGMNGDTLGTLQLRSFWDSDTRSVIIGAENRIGYDTPLTVTGYYTPATDSIDVDIRLAKVGLERLGTYASEIMSHTSGKLSGGVNIVGTVGKPDISGSLILDSVGMKIKALNTRFLINDKVSIVKNRLLFDRFAVKDDQGCFAWFDGEYEIWQGIYDLKVRLLNFQVLNTSFSDNEMFYGKAFLSGVAELNNKDGKTNITVNAKTENDSKLYIPLSGNTTEQSNNFLHFVKTGQPGRRRPQVTYTNSGINLNANLEVNDGLEVQVIFDPTVGDILRTNGNGDIKIAFDKDGSLNMFGEYRISKGNYLFTLSNLVNKKFTLTPGGTISWNGSPYDAMLNLNAVYSLKTSLHELLADRLATDNGEGGIQEKGKKVPVECVLNLTDNLTNPLVKFEINFPSLETQMRSYVQGLFSSQDEVNKQMFSLLVLNKFYPTDNNNANNFGEQAMQSAGLTTLTEMLSSQFSRLVSQFSNNLDFGISYHVGDRQVTSDELEVALSTQLLKDRVTLSVNGNMDIGGTKTVTDNNATNIAGDFDLGVKLNRQGTLNLKAYSHMDEKIIYNKTETIQGVGISYQESFDTLQELLRKYFSFFKRKKETN